ncbi:hypothetical protein EMCRGX_G013137 [Ephydatia muelleri]
MASKATYHIDTVEHPLVFNMFIKVTVVGGGAWLWMTTVCAYVHWGLGVVSLLCRLGARRSHHFWAETTQPHSTVLKGKAPWRGREGISTYLQESLCSKCRVPQL